VVGKDCGGVDGVGWGAAGVVPWKPGSENPDPGHPVVVGFEIGFGMVLFDFDIANEQEQSI